VYQVEPFFLSNYTLVAVGVSLVVALMHPVRLIFKVILWGLWASHEFLISNEVVMFGRNIGTIVSITHRSAALTAVTILVIVWKCLVPAITAVAVSGLLIMSHAVMRDPKHIETTNDFRKESNKESDSDEEGGPSDSEVMVKRPQVRGDVL
jgi:hypothetical protein